MTVPHPQPYQVVSGGLPALWLPARWVAAVLLCLTLLGVGSVCGAERAVVTVPASEIAFSADRIRNDVETLASVPFGGRALGSEGADRAASFIENRFRELGLMPAPGIGYSQQFSARLQSKFSQSKGRNEFSIAGPASLARLTLHKDYLPLPFSGNGRVRDTSLVFAGYAIHAPELGYDDFASIDVRGKVVVALRREPQERSASSRFEGLEFTRHASFAAKAQAVAQRGGKALLIITNRLPAEEELELPAFAVSSGPFTLPIPVLFVRASAIAPFFVEQGLSLAGLVRGIDENAISNSIDFAATYRASLAVKIDSVGTRGANVLAWLPGDPANEEYVVVGAHYDHVGRGERFSMANGGGQGKLHLGADDNASGVAAMLELARVMALRRKLDSESGTTSEVAGSRSILFVAFGAEEHGLFGSAHFLHQEPVKGKQLMGMLNFDMVGRLREDELFYSGLDSVPELKTVAQMAADKAKLSFKPLTEYPYNMSDHGTFLIASIPAVLLFTGLHLEYHTPRDTPDRVNPEGIVRVLRVAQGLVDAFLDPANPLEFHGGKDPGYERQFREMSAPSNPFDFE